MIRNYEIVVLITSRILGLKTYKWFKVKVISMHY